MHNEVDLPSQETTPSDEVIKSLLSVGLTSGESRVGSLVLQGKSNKEVAQRLFISEKTVKFHLTKIFRKLNVKSRSQFIVKFLV